MHLRSGLTASRFPFSGSKFPPRIIISPRRNPIERNGRDCISRRVYCVPIAFDLPDPALKVAVHCRVLRCVSTSAWPASRSNTHRSVLRQECQSSRKLPDLIQRPTGSARQHRTNRAGPSRNFCSNLITRVSVPQSIWPPSGFAALFHSLSHDLFILFRREATNLD